MTDNTLLKSHARQALWLCLASSLAISGCTFSGTTRRVGNDTTLIVGAFDLEVAQLRGQLASRRSHNIEGIECWTGRLAGRNVVLAWTGIGKVNAAATTILLIEHFRPAEVIVCGISGGLNPELSVGDVVIAHKSCQHDLGVWTDERLQTKGYPNRLTGRDNPVFFDADSRLVALAQHAATEITLQPSAAGTKPPKVITGVVATGDTFIMSPAKQARLRNELDADAVEMEGAAIAQICHQRRIPHLILRAISDSAKEKALEEVENYQAAAAANCQKLAAKTIELLAAQHALCHSRAGGNPGYKD